MAVKETEADWEAVDPARTAELQGVRGADKGPSSCGEVER